MSEKVNSDFEDFSSDEETDQHNVLIQTKKKISSKDDIFSKKVEDIESENESDIEEEQKQEEKEDVEQPDKENGEKLDREVEEQASFVHHFTGFKNRKTKATGKIKGRQEV